MDRFRLSNIFCSCSLLALWYFLDTASQVPNSELLNRIATAIKARETTYDNGHYIWIETDPNDVDRKRAKHEFWAREGRYFRREKTNFESSKTGPTKETIVARPERFVKYYSENSEEIGTAADFGDGKEGLAQVIPRYPIKIQNCVASYNIVRLIEDFQSGRKQISNLEAIRNDNGTTDLKFLETTDTFKREYRATLSNPDYFVLSWECQTRSLTDDRWATHRADLTYHPEVKGLVKTMVEKIETNSELSEREKSPSRLDLIDFTLEPASMDLFEVNVGSHNATQVWMNRLISLIIGFSFFCLYYYYRRPMTSVNDRPTSQ